MPPYFNEEEVKPLHLSPLLSDDDEYIDRLGCVEIEFQQEGGFYKPKIVFFLPSANDDCHTEETQLSFSTTNKIDPTEYSIMEDIHDKIDSWLGCQNLEEPTGLKSAMKRVKNNDRPPIDRNVSFNKLEIREFNMTLGDHPSAVSGPPVMMDWNSQPKKKVVAIDQYEQSRGPRRSRRHMKLSFNDRRGILEEQQGFTIEEVKDAWREALLIRKQRQETRMRSPTMNLADEAWESACRKTERLTKMFYDILVYPMTLVDSSIIA